MSRRLLCSELCSNHNSAQTRELQAQLAGQIARALAVFCADEIVIFDDGQTLPRKGSNNGGFSEANENGSKYTGYTNPVYFLAHVLSYLECPPNLRRDLFGMHPDLQFTGLLPSLDMPHHLRKKDWCRYREGTSLSVDSDGAGRGTPVQTGLDCTVYVKDTIPEKSRVTVKFEIEGAPEPGNQDSLIAKVVAPSAPREEAGCYWGYSVRAASSLSTVLTECPFDGGYDLTFGTSERGIPLSDLTSHPAEGKQIPNFNHTLVVFGGLAGLEAAVKADSALADMGLVKPEALFDFWVNLVPGQGSRTIRTEEALWLALMGLRQVVLEKGIK